MSESENKSLENLNRTGRKKGTKNRSTLVREALKGKFENLLETEGEKVFMAVVERAKGAVIRDKDNQIVRDPETGEPLRHPGSDTAAKLILDRIIPVDEGKTAGKLQLGEGGLTIVIEKLEARPALQPLIEGEVAEEAEYEEV